MAEIQARLQPPIFLHQVEDGGRLCVKVIWVSSDGKTGENEVGANLNINASLTCLLFEFCETLLDFSEQDFILETVMRSYSRRLDFFELNPYVDLRQRTKLTIHPQ